MEIQRPSQRPNNSRKYHLARYSSWIVGSRGWRKCRAPGHGLLQEARHLHHNSDQVLRCHLLSPPARRNIHWSTYQCSFKNHLCFFQLRCRRPEDLFIVTFIIETSASESSMTNDKSRQNYLGKKPNPMTLDNENRILALTARSEHLVWKRMKKHLHWLNDIMPRETASKKFDERLLSRKEPASCRSQSSQSKTGIEGMANLTKLQVECRSRLWLSANQQEPDERDSAVKTTHHEKLQIIGLKFPSHDILWRWFLRNGKTEMATNATTHSISDVHKIMNPRLAAPLLILSTRSASPLQAKCDIPNVTFASNMPNEELNQRTCSR